MSSDHLSMHEQARSFLFVPATRLDRVPKAFTSGADEVIVDLEDAVAVGDKLAARAALASMSVGHGCLVRINGLDSPFHDGDVAAVGELGWVTGVVLPKVESAEHVTTLRSGLPADVPVLALIESARGLLAVDAVAQSGVARLLFGSADYLTDIGAPSGREVLSHPRSRLVVASAAARLPPPADGPALQLDDPAATEGEARDAKALGLGAKLCIHPSQVAVVNRVFAASDDELAWARRVLDAAQAGGGGVFVLDGRMVDEPVLGRARRILGGR